MMQIELLLTHITHSFLVTVFVLSRERSLTNLSTCTIFKCNQTCYSSFDRTHLPQIKQYPSCQDTGIVSTEAIANVQVFVGIHPQVTVVPCMGLCNPLEWFGVYSWIWYFTVLLACFYSIFEKKIEFIFWQLHLPVLIENQELRFRSKIDNTSEKGCIVLSSSFSKDAC